MHGKPGGLSRRDFLTWMGAAGLGAWAGCQSGAAPGTPPAIPGVVLDYDPLKTYPYRGWDGATLYTRLCRSCHGEGTFGSWNQGLGRFVPGIRSPGYLARARTAYLQANLLAGRPGTLMAGFAGGLRPDDLDRLLAYLTHDAPAEAARAPVARGDAGRGAPFFADLCAGCHGARGEGLIAPQLANPTFQQTADDAFIAATIREGRARTAMPAFAPRPGSGLQPTEVADLLAIVRAFGGKGPADAK